MVFEAITSAVINYINSIIAANIYLGAFIAMFLETVFPPVPSEVVLPLLGYFSLTSGMGLTSLAAVVLVATAGAVLGAVLIYAVSRFLGRPALLRFGRYLFISERKVEAAERWFAKHGDKAIFLGRMSPIVRELVSVPAGLSEMRFWRFLAYTTAGSLIWNTMLMSVGYFLSGIFETLPISETTSYLAIGIFLSIGIYIAVKHRKGKKTHATIWGHGRGRK